MGEWETTGHWIGTLWNGSPIADIERDDLHREKTRQLGRQKDRLTQTRRYDPLSRLLNLQLHNGRDMLASRSMHYDATGNLNQIEDWKRDKISYDYDPVGQLLKATQAGLVETFAFDPAGNLTDGSSQKTTLANKAGKDHDTWEEGLDHLTEQLFGATRPKIAAITHNLLKSYLGMQFDHDAEGNTVRKIVKGGKDEQPYTLHLHYDAENRLIKAVRPQTGHTMEAEYRYDAFGRRIAKIVRTLKEARATGTYGGSGRMETVQEDITFFVWDGDTLIQEVKPDTTITYLYEPDSFVPLAQVHSDTPDSAYDPEIANRKRIEGEQRQAAEEQEAENLKWLKVTDARAYELAVQAIEARGQQERQDEFARLEQEAQGDRIYYINADHLGTPQEAVSEDGKVVWLARYKAWGRIHKLDREEIRQPFRFQGQYEDAETGLFYNRYRYYDPDSARYLTQDPIGVSGGNNLYAYAPSSTSWIDPHGLSRKRAGGASSNSSPKSGGAQPCMQTLYRGDSRSGVGFMKSHAAVQNGYAAATSAITNGDENKMMQAHARDSRNPLSPYISVTSNPKVAEYFATNGGQTSGTVYELHIPCDRVKKNPHNNMSVMIDGKYVSEDEWLVKGYIRPSEIKGKRKVP